jgi:Xaa-Pro aminopeptidase
LERSDQFGLAYLRFARKLEPGFVLTVEPGIYFIPELIKKWQAENYLESFINYPRVEEYLNFGGIRIEDDILITQESNRVLGESIPKTIAEIEKACTG